MQNKNKIGFVILLILNLFIFSDAASAQDAGDYVDINGKLEVIHSDDFEHPENSKYIFYLNVDGKRYELESKEQLPVVISGTPAHVKGRLSEEKIIVESFEIKPQTAALSQQEQELIAESAKEERQESKFNLNWLYLAAPIIFVIILLCYVEINRLKGHSGIAQERRQLKISALRQYVATNLRKGYTKEQIRNALIKNNYSNEEIGKLLGDKVYKVK